jgi:membrane protein YqaA with SNARE-associated domain
LSDPATYLYQLALQYGYVGVFFAALLGSSLPFVPIPFLIGVVVLSNTLDPLLLGVAAGLGSTIGKVTSYMLGRGGYTVSSERTKKNMDALRTVASKYGDLGVFIFAVTPLPDDLLYVPIGATKFPFWRFLLANAAGKLILSIGVAYFGKAYIQLAESYLGTNELVTILLVFALTVSVTIVLGRADWGMAYSKYEQGGIMAVLRSLNEILAIGSHPSQEGK